MNAGKQTTRTWVWRGMMHSSRTTVWVTQLEEDRYLSCSVGGDLEAYESHLTPSQGAYSWRWELLP